MRDFVYIIYNLKLFFDRVFDDIDKDISIIFYKILEKQE